MAYSNYEYILIFQEFPSEDVPSEPAEDVAVIPDDPPVVVIEESPPKETGRSR